MQKTQIYFEENMLEALKKKAGSSGISLSAYIRGVLKKDLENQHKEPVKSGFSEFSGIWKNRDIEI